MKTNCARMEYIKKYIEFLKTGEKLTADHAYLPCHMVFDVEIDFTKKARYVADEHLNPDPITSTFAGVVLRESVLML